MTYKIRFINEDRTTLKYKVARDVSNVIKIVAKVCVKLLPFTEGGTTYQTIQKHFSSFASLRRHLMTRGGTTLPIFVDKITVNDEQYDFVIVLMEDSSDRIDGSVNKDKQLLTITLHFNSLDRCSK